MDDAMLQTIWQNRQLPDNSSHLSTPLALLMKNTLGKRVRQLGQLAKIWDDLIPEELADHTALESFSRGVLTVIVDSSPHRFTLRTLLDGGLTREIQARFPGALTKIHCRPGQFSSVDLAGSPRYEF